MLDEDVLRDLLARSTDDLHAPPSVTADVLTRERRRGRRRVVARAGATTVAAGTALGFVAQAGGPTRSEPTAPQPITLTAAQRTLHGLAAAAGKAAAPQGRYAVLTEIQDAGAKRTSVIDGTTGDVWTYQRGPGIPSELPVARHDSATQAQFDAIPTDVDGLRAYLIAADDADTAKAAAAMASLQAKVPAAERKRVVASPVPTVVRTADDKVFDQAQTLLWSPLAGPTLRAALFGLLASTPGVVVDEHAKDDLGRSAVEVSRVDAGGTTVATFQDPATSRTLESSWVQPGSETARDVYLSITRAATLPANPYTG